MSKTPWTPEQETAIYDRGGSLLLSAAAGSGKTAVLVERVVSLVADEDHPLDVSQLLIVTFSNAAAAEMRIRIGKRISEMIRENPENRHLQKQYHMLSSAPIQTIHAFCMNLIRTHFHQLDISPDFTILDEKEGAILKEEIAGRCIEEFYQNDDSGEFSTLVELLSSTRDDSQVVDTIFKIYGFARSHPFHEDWLDEKLSMYQTKMPASQSVWGKTLIAHTKETLEFSKLLLEDSMELLIGDETLEKAYLPCWESDLAQVNNTLQYLNAGDWDGAVSVLRGFAFIRLGSVRGNDEEKEKAKAARDQVKKFIQPLSERYLNATEEEFKEDIRLLEPQIRILFDLVKAFGNALNEEKKNRKKLDFSDLEHYALELLVTKEGNVYSPTPDALEIGGEFAHVLVDEYQDCNEVQELLFTHLSNGGERLFMVGDVKQSIYSFRLAMPEIFMRKKETFFPYDKDFTQYPAVINLDKNFRSREEVTESVNFIFSQIMSKDMGEIDYNDEESLKTKNAFPEYSSANPELLVINAEDYQGERDYTQIEAEEVAKKIRFMLRDEYMVTTKDGMRPAVPQDFCILMRSPRGRAEVYIKALEKYGITGVADSSSTFMNAREIAPVVSLLMVLDNPLLDIELAAIMLSPMFGFSDDETARIRLTTPDKAMYVALVNAANDGDIKSHRLVDVLTKLRYFSATHPAHEIITEIYRLTNWLEIARAMPLGNGRYNNLLLLVEHASYYHSMGYKGLAGFTRLLHRLVEQGDDLDGAANAGEGENTVQILSIHRSKGLEFPIVILADTGRQFNKRDLYENTLIHSEYGFATMQRNQETMSQYPTIPMGAIRLEMQKTMLSEEMRILYVALTRAKEKLVVTATVRRHFNRYLERQHIELVQNKLPSFLVGEASSYSDWIMMSLMHHKSGKILLEYGDLGDTHIIESKIPWGISIIEAVDEEAETMSVEPEWRSQKDPQLMDLLETRLNFVYPYLGETLVPNKMAVSQLAVGEDGQRFRFNKRPRFLSKVKLTPAERGNALHKFMQFTNYQGAKDNLSLEINRMKKEEYLSNTEIESLNEEQIKSFFTSDLANRIFESSQVYRELRFITQFGEDKLKNVLEHVGPETQVTLQGVADCVFVENGQGIVVDYKTDRVATMEQLVEYYEKQVLTYKEILKETLGVPIKECILYSFHLSQWVDVLAL